MLSATSALSACTLSWFNLSSRSSTLGAKSTLEPELLLGLERSAAFNSASDFSRRKTSSCLRMTLSRLRNSSLECSQRVSGKLKQNGTRYKSVAVISRASPVRDQTMWKMSACVATRSAARSALINAERGCMPCTMPKKQEAAAPAARPPTVWPASMLLCTADVGMCRAPRSPMLGARTHAAAQTLDATRPPYRDSVAVYAVARIGQVNVAGTGAASHERAELF